MGWLALSVLAYVAWAIVVVFPLFIGTGELLSRLAPGWVDAGMAGGTRWFALLIGLVLVYANFALLLVLARRIPRLRRGLQLVIGSLAAVQLMLAVVGPYFGMSPTQVTMEGQGLGAVSYYVVPVAATLALLTVRSPRAAKQASSQAEAASN